MGWACSKLISSFWVSSSLDFGDPRPQTSLVLPADVFPWVCIRLGPQTPSCPPPPLPPAPTCLRKSQVWPFVLMQTVSVSVAIVEMDRAKLNLISFGRKIEFSTL